MKNSASEIHLCINSRLHNKLALAAVKLVSLGGVSDAETF